MRNFPIYFPHIPWVAEMECKLNWIENMKRSFKAQNESEIRKCIEFSPFIVSDSWITCFNQNCEDLGVIYCQTFLFDIKAASMRHRAVQYCSVPLSPIFAGISSATVHPPPTNIYWKNETNDLRLVRPSEEVKSSSFSRHKVLLQFHRKPSTAFVKCQMSLCYPRTTLPLIVLRKMTSHFAHHRNVLKMIFFKGLNR